MECFDGGSPKHNQLGGLLPFFKCAKNTVRYLLTIHDGDTVRVQPSDGEAVSIRVYGLTARSLGSPTAQRPAP